LKAEREEQYKPKPVITIIDEEDDKVKKDKEVMPPIETEPIESDSDDGVQFDDVSQPEVPSRTPPRHHHHHRRHHRHHQNHHRDGDEIQEGLVDIDRESLKDARPSPGHQSAATPVQSIPPSLDEDSRMSLVSEPEKTSGSKCLLTIYKYPYKLPSCNFYTNMTSIRLNNLQKIFCDTLKSIIYI